MILKFKTVKEWEDYGLLQEIPEDRKEMVVSCFNIATKWLMEGSLVSSERQGEIETLMLPLFYRIAKFVDLTEMQVLEICKEFRQSWLQHAVGERYPEFVDPEAEFLRAFAEMKINQYKQK